MEGTNSSATERAQWQLLACVAQPARTRLFHLADFCNVLLCLDDALGQGLDQQLSLWLEDQSSAQQASNRVIMLYTTISIHQ